MTDEPQGSVGFCYAGGCQLFVEVVVLSYPSAKRGGSMANFQNKEMDIAKNIRVIEWLKTELLDNISGLFRAFLRGGESVLLDFLSHIVLLSYLLARRCGISYQELSKEVLHKVDDGIAQGHQVEEWYGDLSELKEFLKPRR